MSKELSKELENVSGGLHLEIEQVNPNADSAGWAIIDRDSDVMICGADSKKDAIARKKKLEAHVAKGNTIGSFFDK